MFIHRIMLVCLTACLWMHPCPSFSFETDLQSKRQLERVLEGIEEKKASLETFVAKFVQTRKTRLLQKPLRSEGLIYFDRNGKMLWKVVSPSPFAVLVTDDTLHLKYPDLGKTKKTKINRKIGALKKYFGFGQSTEALKQYYEIELISSTNPDTYHLRLVPKRKAAASRVETIEVVISKATWLPEEIRFKEPKGNHTSLRLYFTLINAGLPEGVFSLSFVENQNNPTQTFHRKGGKQ